MGMTHRAPPRHDAGFTLVETLLVASMALGLATASVAWSRAAADGIEADANLRIVLGQLTVARETAINQRRSVEVRFTPPNIVQVIRHDLPAGTTVISTAVLAHALQFQRFPTVPDTPDSFGGTTALSFGAATQVMFSADGMFTDGTGTPVNGSIFIGRFGQTDTARALTVFGATARVRTYRWSGSTWGH
jgi:Tfp pilus assembly protein FimT